MNSSVDQVGSEQVERGGPQEMTIARPRKRPHAVPGRSYGRLSRLRSYLIIDPLIWLYTLVLGVVLLGLIVLVALLAPWLAPDPADG